MCLIRSFIALCMIINLTYCASALELEGEFWNMTPDGTAAVGEDGDDGTEIDIADDLGYDSAENVFGASVIVGEMHQLSFSYLGFDISANNTIQRRIQFGDRTFLARANVSSSLDASLLRGAYRFNAGSDSTYGGFLIGAQYADFNATLSARFIGQNEEQAEVLIPVVGGFIRFDSVPFIGFKASITAGSWDWDTVSATFVDAEGAILFNLPPPFYGGIGYRYLALDGEDTSIPLEVDLTFSGPTAYIGLIF